MLKLVLGARFAVLAISIVLAAHGGEQTPFGRYKGPHALGPYNLDRRASMTSILAKLGAKPAKRFIYCFADKTRGTYLYVEPPDDASDRVASLLLSSFPNCEHLPIQSTTIDPSMWRTPEGIGIGASKEAVVRAYGKPLFVRKLDKHNDVGVVAGVREPGASQENVGDSSYLYSCLLSAKQSCANDLRVTRMGFNKGKLIWIHISNSE